jgi:hypothetical protein
VNRVGWDATDIHLNLLRLIAARSGFRIRRTLHRILSPRRLLATSLTVGFLVLYLLNGVFILSARQPADPERLRLWLSGGMVIYAIYHGLRCAWSNQITDLDLTQAEHQWLGGAPIQRSSLAIYHAAGIAISAAAKTLLLAVVLCRDAPRWELLILGIFTSLVPLEIVRLTIGKWASGLNERQRMRYRVAMTAIAAALALQTLAHIAAMTPLRSAMWLYLLNGFRGLGLVASSDVIQWLSLPWIPAAHLAVSPGHGWLAFTQILGSLAMLPIAIWTLVQVDAHGWRLRLRWEQARLAEGRYESARSISQGIELIPSSQLFGWFDGWIPRSCHEAFAVVSRQWISVQRYRGTIGFSFLIPMLLCLSPLITGQVKEQWFYVVGGIALCTMLLAPPALRIDFRRDLRRMLLLCSLPVRPLSMVLGQLALPILITWTFQWMTLAIAVIATSPSWSQVVLWTGLLNALAVFTFAAENALFLTYPHHERSEGIAMMVRAKLTFLGKGTVIAVSLAMLVSWATLCRRWLPGSYAEAAFVAGAILATWIMAATAIAAATICWRRFDPGLDIPPQ